MNFTLKRASDALKKRELEEDISVCTIDDLKSILNKYPYEHNFDMDALIIDFRNKEIIIYDDYVE